MEIIDAMVNKYMCKSKTYDTRAMVNKYMCKSNKYMCVCEKKT
jgi:hypothetical protein